MMVLSLAISIPKHLYAYNLYHRVCFNALVFVPFFIFHRISQFENDFFFLAVVFDVFFLTVLSIVLGLFMSDEPHEAL